MLRESIQDLLSFIVVARERSFTRAAAQLGMSQSGVSHAMRALEERLQVRLLTRTIRSVSLTAEGERLLEAITPRLEEIEQELGTVSDLMGLATANAFAKAGAAVALADVNRDAVEAAAAALRAEGFEAIGVRCDVSVRWREGADVRPLRLDHGRARLHHPGP